MAVYTTLAEAKAAYLTNADYHAENSVSKAKDFASACRALLILMPSKSGQQDQSVEFNTQFFRDEMTKAEAFVQAQNNYSSVSYADVRGIRE